MGRWERTNWVEMGDEVVAELLRCYDRGQKTEKNTNKVYFVSRLAQLPKALGTVGSHSTTNQIINQINRSLTPYTLGSLSLTQLNYICTSQGMRMEVGW